MKSITRKRWHPICPMLGLALLAAVDHSAWAADPQTRGPERIEHIVVIYLENRSFDNLYAIFLGRTGCRIAARRRRRPIPKGRVTPPFRR
jgi:phospholipase C